jgi:large subunit ribosomal protein L18
MNKKISAQLRSVRNRAKLKRNASRSVRLSVFRSNQNIEAQLIDDSKGITVACASTLQKKFRDSKGSDCKAAESIGTEIATIGLALGVKEIYFDRGSYAYHGRVKALADAARAAGLEF